MASFSNQTFARMATTDAIGELEKTNIFAETLGQRGDIAAISWEDIGLSQYLGESGFSSVFQVKVYSAATSTKSKNRRRRNRNRRRSLSDTPMTTISNSGGKSQYQQLQRESYISSDVYSLKCLNLNTSRKDFVFAAMDLLFEAGLLSNLKHDNVVRLGGVCEDNLVKAYQKHDSQGYFFVYDAFSESLRDRLLTWREAKHKLRSKQRLQSIRRPFSPNASRSSSTSLSSMTGDGITGPPPVSQRLEDVALGVARAMSYLHEQKIVLRDLRPESIGFDATTDIVKICDLGLARPIEDVDDVAGSTWYLAPEYARGSSCGFKSDVYSFAVVLYELVTLKIPFRAYRHNVPTFTKLVLMDGERPSLDKVARASDSLSSLIHDCWDGDPDSRPNFNQVVRWIEEIVDAPFTEYLDDSMNSASTSIMSSVFGEFNPPSPVSPRSRKKLLGIRGQEASATKRQSQKRSVLERQLDRLRFMGSKRQLKSKVAT